MIFFLIKQTSAIFYEKYMGRSKLIERTGVFLNFALTPNPCGEIERDLIKENFEGMVEKKGQDII